MDVDQIKALKPRLEAFLARFGDCFTHGSTREHLATYVNGQLSDLAPEEPRTDRPRRRRPAWVSARWPWQPR